MLKIYNSLSREIEEFKPLNNVIKIYTCGPTVYDFAHIGNFRTYTTADLLIRALKYNDYEVNYVMNITDVGHLTGDNLGDADTGEDRMERSARLEGRSAYEIADFYTKQFIEDYVSLNLIKPELFAKATEHIKEQIELIKELEIKGYTYQTSDGIYFDTSKFSKYGELSNLDQIKEGARIEKNPEKRNPRDFALWKFSPAGEKRQMEWESPWGTGFPGWHIECSAMSMKYLGDSLDIHIGGIDLRETHHPNEIAQSEAVTGKQFVKYWIHCAFVLVQGERMSKSKGNNYKLFDLEKEGFDPLVVKYLYLQTHYRQEMNFTFPALEAAKISLNKLREFVIHYDTETKFDMTGAKEFDERFLGAINNDLNTAEALAVVWDIFKSNLSNEVIAKTLVKYDRVLGLDLKNAQLEDYYINKKKLTPELISLLDKRGSYRKERKYKEADEIRDKIRRLGYEIDDTKNGGVKIRKLR